MFTSIHAFNKSGHHLEFSINDGKIIHLAKMATKDKSSVDVDFAQCVHVKRNVFTLYQEEHFLYTMSLWVCYGNFKAFMQRFSWINDIKKGQTRADRNEKKKMRINSFGLLSWLTSTDKS